MFFYEYNLKNPVDVTLYFSFLTFKKLKSLEDTDLGLPLLADPVSSV